MVALYGIYQVLLLILLILLIIKFYVNYGVSLVILIVELFTVLLKLLVQVNEKFHKLERVYRDCIKRTRDKTRIYSIPHDAPGA